MLVAYPSRVKSHDDPISDCRGDGAVYYCCIYLDTDEMLVIESEEEFCSCCSQSVDGGTRCHVYIRISSA